MKQVLLLLTFLILGAISQPVYAYQDAVCHVMTSDSISLYVHVKGEGPMCLYLHGGPGSGSTWMEAVSGHMLEKRRKRLKTMISPLPVRFKTGKK